MRRKVSTTAVLFALMACARAPVAGAPSEGVAASRAATAPDPGTPPSSTTVTLRGHATSEAHYCGGGAAATEEMIRAARRSTPLANETFRANPGRQIDLSAEKFSFDTSADGTFTVILSKGTWCVYRASRTPVAAEPSDAQRQRPSPTDRNFDAECLEQEKLRCDQTIEADAEPVEVNLQISEGCPEEWNQTCWIGPMPP